MKESFREYMKVGIILHMAYRGLATGEGPILESLSKIAVDDYFEVVEVTQMKDPEVRKKAQEMIEVSHLNVAYGGQYPRFGFPGSENDVEQLAAYLKILLEIGFLNKEKRPIVSFEVKPYGHEDSAFVIANAKRTLNLAWQMI